MVEWDVWYRFVEENGKPYRDLSYDRVKLSADQLLIIDFRDKVHAEKSTSLEGIDRAGLKVYENEQEREAGNALEEDADIGNRGTSKATALLVVVPASSRGAVSKTLDPFFSQVEMANEEDDMLKFCAIIPLTARNQFVGKNSLFLAGKRQNAENRNNSWR